MAVNESSIGAMLRARREELQKTQKEIADYVGVSEGTISRWESGYTDSMRRDKIARLSKALNISPLDILGIKDTTGLLPQVSAKVTIDNTSPFYKIYQAYICRPDVVKKEMIKRFSDMDATFSRKVSNLLQASGDINGFMAATNTPFATVGKLMQGETVQTTPEEAMKIANYFNADVVDLFFDNINAESLELRKKSSSNKQKTEQPPEPEIKQLRSLSFHGKKVYAYIKEPSKNGGFSFIKNVKYHHLLCNIKVDRFISSIIKAVEDYQLQHSMPFNPEPAYKVIAKKIKQRDFMDNYVNKGEEGLSTIKTIIFDKLS